LLCWCDRKLWANPGDGLCRALLRGSVQKGCVQQSHSCLGKVGQELCAAFCSTWLVWAGSARELATDAALDTKSTYKNQ
jgi:hypothetical protein